MTVRSIFIDFGGVIARTEDKAPRQQQAERLGMTCAELEKLIFEGHSSVRASLGEITEEAHWQAVAETLKLPPTEADRINSEFFAGDRIDHDLLDTLRQLRPAHKVGLISNAWSGLRSFFSRNQIEDAFDLLVISAEVGFMKPDARIYRLALEKSASLAEESVFIDDLPANVEGARAVGMAGIQFKTSGQTLEELSRLLAK